MAIFFDDKTGIFKIDTANSSYVFCVSYGNFLEHLYYGKKIPNEDLRYISNRQIYTFNYTTEKDCQREFALSTVLAECSSFNYCDFRIPSISIENGDGTLGDKLVFETYSVKDGVCDLPGLPFCRNDCSAQTLTVTIADKDKGIAIDLVYVVFDKYDVIARHCVVKNLSDKSARLFKAASACLDFSGENFDLINLKGMYLYERAAIQRVPLNRGVYSFGSALGATAHHENPFFIVCDKHTDEDVGNAYGFNLLYSGNFLNEIEVDRLLNVRIVLGINPQGFEWRLNSGESFCTPQAVMTYSDCGIGGTSRNFHDFIRNCVIDEKNAFKTRPVVINSWESAYFDVSEKFMLDLADEAKKCGADTVVLDDGWFRNDAKSGLGDFYTDKTKFPDGIAGLSEKIHAKGLDFGIWIEPEMASPDSDFLSVKGGTALSSHPDRVLGRNQLVIDLTDEKNVKTITDRIISELSGAKIDYIKWDMNRYVTDAASDRTSSGETYHRQVLGVYKALSIIKNAFPDALIETCAGGGGRFDLGMLFYSSQIWTSDNTDPYARAYIQYGTSLGYPQSAISCHYTEGVCTSGRESSPKFRCLVASFGAFGYELNLSKLTEEEKTAIKGFSEVYKKNREFVVDSDLYRIIAPETDKFCAYINVSKDKKRALFTFLHINSTGFYENILVKLKGLDEKKNYVCSLDGTVHSGAALMRAGIRMKDLFKEKSGSGLQISFCEKD